MLLGMYLYAVISEYLNLFVDFLSCSKNNLSLCLQIKV